MEIYKRIDGFEDYWIGNVDNDDYAIYSEKRKTNDFMTPQKASNGYLYVNLSKNGKTYHNDIHRLKASAFILNPKPNILTEVDHIDRTITNNKVSNLRWVKVSHNKHNRKKKQATSSKYKGVCWDKSKKKWQAGIKINGKLEFLGRFNNEEEAGRAYDKRAFEFYGNFSLNFPDEHP